MNGMLRLLGLDLLGALREDEQARLHAWEAQEPALSARWREELRSALDAPLEDARELGFLAAVEAAGRAGAPNASAGRRSRRGRAAALATMVAAAVLLSMLLPRGEPAPGLQGIAPVRIAPARGGGGTALELRDAVGGSLPVLVEVRSDAASARWSVARYNQGGEFLGGELALPGRAGLHPVVLLLPADHPELAAGGRFTLELREGPGGARLGAWGFKIRR